MNKQMVYILLVEDEENHAELVRRAFESHSDRVCLAVAGSLQEARTCLTESQVDLIIADFVLPDGRGTELLTSGDEEHHSPLVMMTSHGDEHIAVEAMKAGALDYVVKSATTLADMPRIAKRALREWGHIIERKRAEDASRESELRYRTLFESTRDAIIIVDLDGRILSANPASAVLLGYENLQELVGMPASKLHVSPEQREVVVAELMERGYIEDYELELVKKDGTPVYIIASSTVHRDEQGNILQLEGFFKNITARKKAEEELQNANRRLEETLAELKVAQQQIIQQERLRALGQMASGVAHDFNNALTPILGYCQLIFMVPETLDDKEKAMSYLKLMNTTAQDASSIVTRLRAFYRERREDEIWVSVNLNQLAKQTIELTTTKWKDQAQSDGITINVRSDLQKVPFINGNESELRNALTNLIFNAVDAIEESGTITIRTHFNSDVVVLEVSDTGCGMTDEVQQRCFEPFFSTKEEDGTGMGLAMVHGIIRRHEGTIEIKSEPGEGTTVIIRLPIPSEELTEGERQEAEATTRSLNVLLVDDIPEVRDVISQYLLVDGHAVETANNGREGLETFYKGRFDLVITDRAMPDINGVQLAMLIKQVAPEVPIIMLTGFGDMMKITGDIPAEIDYLLSKPVTLSDFREALAKVIAE